MKPLSAILVLCAVVLLAVPVSAEYVVTGAGLVGTGQAYPAMSVFRYNTTPGTSIQRIEMDLPINTVVNFTLYYGTGSTVSGYCIYQSVAPAALSLSEIQLGDASNVHSEIFIDAQAAGYALIKHVQWSSYAVNRTTSGTETQGFALHDPYYGTISRELVFYEVPNLRNNLVYGIVLTSTQPVDIWVFTAETGYLSERVSKTYVDSLFEFGQGTLDIGFTIMAIVQQVMYWIKFIFFDNLVLTVALYFAVTMAYSAMRSGGDMSKFYTKFFRLQKTLLSFLMEILDKVVNIMTSLINALKPV